MALFNINKYIDICSFPKSGYYAYDNSLFLVKRFAIWHSSVKKFKAAHFCKNEK